MTFCLKRCLVPSCFVIPYLRKPFLLSCLTYSNSVMYTFVNKGETLTFSPYLILPEFGSSWVFFVFVFHGTIVSYLHTFSESLVLIVRHPRKHWLYYQSFEWKKFTQTVGILGEIYCWVLGLASCLRDLKVQSENPYEKLQQSRRKGLYGPSTTVLTAFI